MNTKTLSEKPIAMVELRKQLQLIEERDKELNFRANKTKDYLNNFISLDEKQEQDLRKKIEALKIPRLKEEHIVKILDLLPKKLDELKAILQQFTVTISSDNMKKIAEVINSFVPKKEKK